MKEWVCDPEGCERVEDEDEQAHEQEEGEMQLSNACLSTRQLAAYLLHGNPLQAH
jgi:hypothetical protein